MALGHFFWLVHSMRQTLGWGQLEHSGGHVPAPDGTGSAGHLSLASPPSVPLDPDELDEPLDDALEPPSPAGVAGNGSPVVDTPQATVMPTRETMT